LNTVLNYLELHFNNNHSATLSALRNRFGLLTNDLVNDSVDAMMAVLSLNTTRRSRSSTPTLPDNFFFEDMDDWSYSPPRPTEARDNYESEILKDGLNLPQVYFEDGKFPSVPRRAHDVPASFTKHGRTMSSKEICNYYTINKEFPRWINDLFRGEMHALFIRCRNLDDPKTNGIIKKFLKILVPEIGEQNFDDAALKFRSTFIEWRHFLVNINIPAIREESTISNNFEKLLTDVVRAGIWALISYNQKDAQIIFFNLNNDLYTVNMTILTLSGWNVATSIDLSRYNFTAQR
ncbi:6710_t:CDS:2, partial [Scutellospora calospora]